MALTKRSYNPYQIAGKSVTAALRNPGAGEDGKVPVWNNATRRWEPGAGGGGASPFQDGYSWAANANALPAWTPGQYGYGIGDRFNPGDAGYLSDGVFMLKIGAGNTFADFLFIAKN